jgi:hypothetical protein
MENPDYEFELSREDRELLGRARRSRAESRPPEWVRQRIVARTLAEVQHGRPSLTISAAELVPVAPGGSRASLLATALAVAVVLPFYLRNMSAQEATDQALAETAETSAETSSSASSRVGRDASERLLDMPLFRAPAGVLGKSAPPPRGPSLFGDRPFSELSQAWQVRRWNNLKWDPTDSAVFDFDEGALCVALEPGERVIGGWPWMESDALAPESETAERTVAPEAVPLAAGKAYRLTLTAWAHEPVPAQMLVAVGHSRLPFSAAAGARVPVTTEPQSYVVDFAVKSSDPSVGVAFLAMNAKDSKPSRVCVSDVTLHER